MMRVRFPLPAPITGCAHIAQSVEHFLGKEEVTGSNPVMSSILFAVSVLFIAVLVLALVVASPKVFLL